MPNVDFEGPGVEPISGAPDFNLLLTDFIILGTKAMGDPMALSETMESRAVRAS
jgi:hypothetical protein